MSHEDVHKQELASQLFKGVSSKHQPSPNRGHLSRRGLGRGEKAPAESTQRPRNSTDTQAKSNADLLLDLEGFDIVAAVPKVNKGADEVLHVEQGSVVPPVTNEGHENKEELLESIGLTGEEQIKAEGVSDFSVAIFASYFPVLSVFS